MIGSLRPPGSGRLIAWISISALLLPTSAGAGEPRNERQSAGSSGERRWDEASGRSRGYGRFALGVCVGQSLQRQGITLPLLTRELSGKLDEDSRKSLEDAIQACRSQFQGEGASTALTSPPSG